MTLRVHFTRSRLRVYPENTTSSSGTVPVKKGPEAEVYSIYFAKMALSLNDNIECKEILKQVRVRFVGSNDVVQHVVPLKERKIVNSMVFFNNSLSCMPSFFLPCFSGGANTIITKRF